jgi:hypothetical protein
MTKPLIEQYYDPHTDMQYVRLCLPRSYLIAVRRPRLSLFWQLIRLCWAGVFQSPAKPGADHGN